MFVCDKCGESRSDSEALLRQVGGSGVICRQCFQMGGDTLKNSALMQSFRERDFERRESIALAILAANLSNPAMNGPNVVLTVRALIAASFKTADEFILFSTESYRLELKVSGQVD